MKLYCYADRNQHGHAQKYLLATLGRFNEFEVVYEPRDGYDSHPVLLEKAKRVLAFATQAKAAGETSFVWADNDIVVFKPFRDRLLALLGENDVMFQSAGGYICAGFFVAKLNDAFINYWTAVVNKSECYTILGGTGDQHAADLLRKMVRLSLLPEDEFWTPFRQAPAATDKEAVSRWTPCPPPSARLVHMCCVQYPEKLRALDHCLALS
jgi:hypothetical protein